MAEFGNLGTASIRVTAFIGDALTKIENVSKKVQGLGNTISAVSGVLKDVAVNAGMLGAAISVPMVKLVKTGMDFEKTMSAVKAVVADLRIGTAEAGERLANLGELAKKLGADTMFSAKQVAEAMHFLGVAGFTSKEIFEGVNATLSLAAAGMLDLDVAASIAADTMIAFGISATQIGRIADDFAAVASSTNTTIQLLGESMKYVSPIASALGQSLEEVVISLGLLARAGLKGSIAGASLSQVLSQLMGKSDKLNEKLAKYGLTFADVNPEVVKLTDIIRIFAVVGLQKTDAMELFMVRAGRALTTMMNAGEEATSKLAGVIEGSFGAALIQAGIRVKNVAGTWEQFQGAIESLSITLFQQMSSELNSTLNYFIDILVQVRFWVEENDVVMRQLLKITAYVGAIAIALSAVAVPLAVITGAFGFVITQLGIFGGMLGGIPGLLASIVATPFMAIKGAVEAVITSVFGLKPLFVGLSSLLGFIADGITTFIISLGNLGSVWGTITGVVTTFMAAVGGVPGLIATIIGVAVFGGLIAVLITLKQNWDYVVQAFQAGFNTVIRPVIEGFAAAVIWMWENAIKPVWDVLVDSVQRLLESVKAAWVALEPLKVVFQALGAVIGGVLAGALVAVIGLFVGLTETLKGMVDLITWAIDTAIELGRKLGIVGEETKTSTERLNEYSEAAKKAAVESKNLLESTREADTERKREIGSARELVKLMTQQAKGANTIAQTEELIRRMNELNVKSVQEFIEKLRAKDAGLEGELLTYRKNLAAMKLYGAVTDENKKSVADLENHIVMLENQLQVNKQIYADATEILVKYNGSKDKSLEQYEEELKHFKAVESAINDYDKARLESIELEKELSEIKYDLHTMYLEGTDKELAQLEKIKNKEIELADATVLRYKTMIENRKISIKFKEDELKAGTVEEGRLEATHKAVVSWKKEIAILEKSITDAQEKKSLFLKKDAASRDIILRKEGETRKKYFLELQKIEAERAKDFLRVAEIEKQLLKDRNAEKWKELRITEEDAKKSKEVAAQRIEALRLEAEQMVAIDAKAQEEILKEHERVEKEKEKLEKEREKKLKTLDATATLEQKATDQVAKQVRSVQDLFVLYNALYLIRLRQEQLAFRAAERALEAQQKLRKAQEQAAKQPENKSLAIKIEKLELTAKLWGAVATKMTNAAGIPIFDDIQVISANNVSIAGGIKPVAGAGVGGVGGGVGGKGGVGAGGVGGGAGGDAGIGGASLGIATVNGSPVYVNGSPVYVSGKLITDIAGAVRGTVGGGVGGLAGGGAGGDLTPRSGITPRGGVVPRSGIVPEHPIIPRGAVTPAAPTEVKGAYTTDIENFARAVKDLKAAIDKEYRARGDARRISLKEAADKLTLKRIETGKDDTGRLHRTFGSLIKEILEELKDALDAKAGKVPEKVTGVERPAVVDREMDTKVGDYLIKMLDRAEAMRIKSEASLLKVGVRALDSLISKGLIPKETRAWFVESLKAEVKERVKLREEEKKSKLKEKFPELLSEAEKIITYVGDITKLLADLATEKEKLKTAAPEFKPAITYNIEEIESKITFFEGKLKELTSGAGDAVLDIIEKVKVARKDVEVVERVSSAKIPEEAAKDLTNAEKELSDVILRRTELEKELESLRENEKEGLRDLGNELFETETKFLSAAFTLENLRKMGEVGSEKYKEAEKIYSETKERYDHVVELMKLVEGDTFGMLKADEKKFKQSEVLFEGSRKRGEEGTPKYEALERRYVRSKEQYETVSEAADIKRKEKELLDKRYDAEAKLKSVLAENADKIKKLSENVEKARLDVILANAAKGVLSLEEATKRLEATQNELTNAMKPPAKIERKEVTRPESAFSRWQAEEAAKAGKPRGESAFDRWKKDEAAKAGKSKPESALERWQARMRADEGKEKPKTAFETWQEKKYGKAPEVPKFDAGRLGEGTKPEVKNEYDSLLKELLAFFRKNNAPGEKEVSEVDVSSIVQTKMETANKIASKLHKPEATLTDVVNTLKEEFSKFSGAGMPFKDYKANLEQRNEWIGAPAPSGSTGTVEPTSSGADTTTTTTVDSLIDKDLFTQKVNDMGEIIGGLSDFVLAEFEEIKEEFRIAPFKWADVFVEEWREKSKRMIDAARETFETINDLANPKIGNSPSFRSLVADRVNILQKGLTEMNSMVKKSLPNFHQMNFGNVTVPKPKPISTAGMSTTQNINQLNDHRSVAMTVNSNMDVVNMQRHIGSALAKAAMNVGQI